MSMLDRYKKPGGFLQLLALLESCGHAKQENFLKLIRIENSAWADLLTQKLITIERVYTWSDEVFAEVIGSLNDLTVATAIHGAPELVRIRIFACFATTHYQAIKALFLEKIPQAQDILTAQVKIIETVRSKVKEGVLLFERFDSALSMGDNVENDLERKTAMPTARVL